MSSQSQPMPGQNDPQFVELDGELYIAKFFDYVMNVVLAGNAAGGGQIQIDSDADFQLFYLVADYTSKLCTVQVSEGGAGGVQWSNLPVNIDLFAGTAQLPFPIGLIPQLLPKRRTYNFNLVDSSGQQNTIQLIFRGYKLYPAAQAGQLGAAPSQS